MLKNISIPFTNGGGKKGFTLAEVLITLSLIGIVAALTVPSLVRNFEETHYKVAWKKAFSMANQAGMLIAAKNGGDLLGASELTNALSIRNAIEDAMGGYITKDCGSCGDNKCFPPHKELNGSSYYRACTGIVENYGGATVITKSGMSINISHPSGESCATTRCFALQIDVNGPKKPNVYGKDTFGLYIDRTGRAYPWGTGGDPTIGHHGCPNGVTGLNCSAYYLSR